MKRVIPPKNHKGPKHERAVRYEERPDGLYVYTKDAEFLKWEDGWQKASLLPFRGFHLAKSADFSEKGTQGRKN